MNFHKFLFRILFSVSLVFLFGVGLVKPVWAAASLYLAPSAGTYTTGNTFSVEVKVNSGGVAINAADGTLVFDPNDLEVRSVSKENSVFNLWVQEPTFSNSLGTISFGGGKPTPGFTGAAGTILTVVFRGKSTGTANVSFASGSVLADDGKGTNVLYNTGAGSYKLVTREITPVPPPAEEYPPTGPGQTPAAPIVSSVTHPEEDKWYSNNDPEFSWKLPSDVTGVSLLLHQKSDANSGNTSDGLMGSKKYENIEDGVWYFHIKFRNQYGWGKILHRKVLIDTAPPEEFKIIVDKKGEIICPAPVLYFETKDNLSGLEYYEVIIDGNEGKNVALADITRNPFQMPVQTPGGHAVEVKAFDKAGNYTSATAQVEISPIQQAPVITKYPERLDLGENLTIEGESLPDITNLVFIQQKGREAVKEQIKADENGKWIFTSLKPLEKGEYEAWAVSQDERGAQSLPSSKITFSVNLPPFLKIGKIVIDYLTIMVIFIVLIAAAIVVIFYGWYRISMWRKRIRLETKELSQSISAAFKALKEEVEEQIEYLDEKPGLTKSERAVRDKLKQSLDIAEGFVSKELKDVERELE